MNIQEEKIKTGGPQYQKKYYQEKYKDYHKNRYQEKKETIKELNKNKYYTNKLNAYRAILKSIDEYIDNNNDFNDIKLIQTLECRLKIINKIEKYEKNIKY